MKNKKVLVSRNGLTTCPSCMSHITLNPELAQTECPFCHTNLVAERRQDGGVFGRNALQTLRKSRSAMLAAALGASLSMAACGEGENNDSEDMAIEDMKDDVKTDQAVYGAPPVDMDMDESLVFDAAYGAPPVDFGPEDADMHDMAPDMSVEDMDMGAPAMDMYGGPPIDMEEDMPAVPAYGLPPMDMG